MNNKITPPPLIDMSGLKAPENFYLEDPPEELLLSLQDKKIPEIKKRKKKLGRPKGSCKKPKLPKNKQLIIGVKETEGVKLYEVKEKIHGTKVYNKLSILAAKDNPALFYKSIKFYSNQLLAVQEALRQWKNKCNLQFTMESLEYKLRDNEKKFFD